MASTLDWIGNYLTGLQKAGEAVHKQRVPDDLKGDKAQTHAIHLLQTQIDELRLLVATLMRLLLEKQTVTELDLKRVAMEIDILDGKADGALHGQVEVDGEIIPDRQDRR